MGVSLSLEVAYLGQLLAVAEALEVLARSKLASEGLAGSEVALAAHLEHLVVEEAEAVRWVLVAVGVGEEVVLVEVGAGPVAVGSS